MEGLVSEEHTWALRDPPSLEFSSGPLSTISEDSPTPLSPSADSVLLPGFHFTTTNEDVDPAEFHRLAAQLLSGNSKTADSLQFTAVDMDSNLDAETHLHCDLGRDPTGRYCCSCGKSYSTAFRLREHTQQCAGLLSFPCPTCDRVFQRKENRDRHVAMRHNDGKEACPECGQLFLSAHLPKHLASGLGGCDGMVQSQRFSVQSSYSSTSQPSWGHSRKASGDSHRASSVYSTDGLQDFTEAREQTRDYLESLLRQPTSIPVNETCDLCEVLFDPNSDELVQHLSEHSLDFTEKRHKCDDCQIFFANIRDLENHLQSAEMRGHCGFTFLHNSDSCTGHHPPTYYRSNLANDHDLMQKNLWCWELTQLRTHRVAVATHLAKRLNASVSPHMTLQDCRRTYTSLLPHFSIANGDAVQPPSGWYDRRYQKDLYEVEQMYRRVAPEVAAATAQRHHHRRDSVQQREQSPRPRVVDSSPDKAKSSPPESAKRLLKRASFIDLTKRRTQADFKRKPLSSFGSWHLLPRQAENLANRPQSLPPTMAQNVTRMNMIRV